MRRFLGWGVLVLLVLALVAGTYFSGWLMAWRLRLLMHRRSLRDGPLRR